MLATYMGFKEEDIALMTDTDSTTVRPTGKNIKVRLTGDLSGDNCVVMRDSCSNML